MTTSATKKPPAVASDDAQSGIGNVASPADSSANQATGSSANQAAPQTPSQPAREASSAAPHAGNAPAGKADGSAAEDNTPAKNAAKNDGAASPDKAADTAASAGTPPPAAQEESRAANTDSAADDSRSTSSDTNKDPNVEEKPAEAAPAPKPRASAAKSRSTAKPAAALPFDQVTEAEKYIYGRGARQDCDRGLRMLQPAAEHSNPKAMISLGALYSTGVCTPRDLPTAYRWFALALRKDPENQQLQDNLQRLWVQMTQPERQLAVKLSQ